MQPCATARTLQSGQSFAQVVRGAVPEHGLDGGQGEQAKKSLWARVLTFVRQMACLVRPTYVAYS